MHRAPLERQPMHVRELRGQSAIETVAQNQP
jgi:hypothetical protein